MARSRRAKLSFLPQCHSVLSMHKCLTNARRRRGWVTGRRTLGKHPSMVEGGESTPCRSKAPTLLLPGTPASPNPKTSVHCGLLCAEREDTAPAPPPGRSGTGKAWAEESLSHPAGGSHGKWLLLRPALSGLTATFRGLFSSSGQEVRFPGPTLASRRLFFFHEPSLYPIPNTSGTLRAQA